MAATCVRKTLSTLTLLAEVPATAAPPSASATKPTRANLRTLRTLTRAPDNAVRPRGADSAGELVSDDLCALDHRLELPGRSRPREVLHSAIRRDDQPLGGHMLERPADAGGH